MNQIIIDFQKSLIIFGEILEISTIVGHAQGAFNAPEPSKDFSLIHTTEERYIERGLLLFCCDRITRGPDSDSKLAVGFIGENTVYTLEQ